jgi:hypothetical protein
MVVPENDPVPPENVNFMVREPTLVVRVQIGVPPAPAGTVQVGAPLKATGTLLNLKAALVPVMLMVAEEPPI